MTRCSACNAPVIWLSHARTGKPAPIDAEPSPDGNIIIDLKEGTYRVLRRVEIYYGELHTNHFATCPWAVSFRRSPEEARA